MADQIRIGDVTPRVRYIADGATALFSYPFPIFTDGDLEVYVGDAEAVPGDEYVISGAGRSGGGAVTFHAAPEKNAAVTLVRRLTIARTSDFATAGEFTAAAINSELDFQIAAVQQLKDELVRAMRLPVPDTGAALTLPGAGTRAERVLAFDENGDARTLRVLDTHGVPDIATATPAADTVSGDAGVSSEASAADHVHPLPAWSDIGIASQAAAEAGTDNTAIMTPLRAVQAVAALGRASDTVTRDLAASALAFTLASIDTAAITGSAGQFLLTDAFGDDSLATSVNAAHDAGATWYHNVPGGEDMTLVPENQSLAIIDPMDVIGYFVIEPVDTITYGTDITGEISVDGGSEFAAGSWTKVGDIGSPVRHLYRLDADVSGQSGSSLVYRLKTANGKQVRVHDCVGLVAIY